MIACSFAGGGELILVGSKAVKDDSFEEIGRIDEYSSLWWTSSELNPILLIHISLGKTYQAFWKVTNLLDS